MLQSEQLSLEEWVSSKSNFDMKQTSAEFSSQKFEYQSTVRIQLNVSDVIFFRKYLIVSQRTHHVQSMSIRRRYYVDTSETKFRRISTSFPHSFSMLFCWSKNPRRFHVLSST